MDPISIIVTALVTGAAAGLKPTVEKVIKDAYDGIKLLIHRKYDRVSTDMVERDPASAAKQNILKEDLEKAGAGADEELLRQAKAVLDSVQRYAPHVAGEVGLILEDIKGASLKIDDIIASGRGVDVRKAEIAGDIAITRVRAGNRGDPSNP